MGWFEHRNMQNTRVLDMKLNQWEQTKVINEDYLTSR